MPRPRIRNEDEAANFLAKAVLKHSQGKINSQDLYAVSGAMQTYMNLKNNKRELRRLRRKEREYLELKEQLDGICADSLGRRIDGMSIIKKFDP